MKYLIVIFLFLLAASPVFANPFSGGDGSPENPYQIRTLEELEAVSDYPDKHFIQKANIRKPLTEPLCSTWDWRYKFTGSYNGNGFLINLNIVNTDTVRDSYEALFAHVAGNAVIKNVVTVGSVRGNHAAGIASMIMNTTNTQDSGVRIINNVNNARIEGRLGAAGIIAKWCSIGIIDNNTNNGSIVSTNRTVHLGGIIADMWDNHPVVVSNNKNSGTLIDNSNFNDIGDCGTSGILGTIHHINIEAVLKKNINHGVMINNGKANPPRVIKGIANISN